MPVHFSEEEMRARRVKAAAAVAGAGLDGLLMFKQESMYYLTGYDSFGFSLFQCLVMDAGGRVALLTRLPDLRQARHTSDVEDVRIWHEVEGADPMADLRALLAEMGLAGGKLGVELDSYGLKAHWWERLKGSLGAFCAFEDASTLVDRLRAVKSPGRSSTRAAPPRSPTTRGTRRGGSAAPAPSRATSSPRCRARCSGAAAITRATSSSSAPGRARCSCATTRGGATWTRRTSSPWSSPGPTGATTRR